MTNTVLILGASGKIGSAAATAFGAAGWTVRPYDRKTDMTKAALGADVIVNGLNPPNYHDWEHIVPAITEQVIAAARASGATVIVPGNVYNFGATPGQWDETTPQRPVSRKGRIRKAMEDRLAASGVQVIVLRAGSFITPDRTDDTMGLMLLRDIGRGRVTMMGAADTLHAYCLVPDWARAAVGLAEIRDRLGLFEDIPFPGPAFSARELRDLLQAELGRPLRLVRFPWWLIGAASPFWELARELREMKYLWFTSHHLGSARFDRLLPGFRHTDRREAMLSGLKGMVRQPAVTPPAPRARARVRS
jgi:nucleoside-diphosphate-sugar epimerase